MKKKQNNPHDEKCGPLSMYLPIPVQFSQEGNNGQSLMKVTNL